LCGLDTLTGARALTGRSIGALRRSRGRLRVLGLDTHRRGVANGVRGRRIGISDRDPVRRRAHDAGRERANGERGDDTAHMVIVLVADDPVRPVTHDADGSRVGNRFSRGRPVLSHSVTVASLVPLVEFGSSS
jgi:hypothetical protein